MKEAQFQTLWHKYLEDNPPDYPEVYELKICNTNRFPLAAVKEHQIDGLIQAEKGLFHKISDSPIFTGMKTRFTAKKPFDCLWIKAFAYVCILFYIPRKQKIVAKIPIYRFTNLVDGSDKKSATLEEIISYCGKEIRIDLNAK